MQCLSEIISQIVEREDRGYNGKNTDEKKSTGCKGQDR